MGHNPDASRVDIDQQMVVVWQLFIHQSTHMLQVGRQLPLQTYFFDFALRVGEAVEVGDWALQDILGYIRSIRNGQVANGL